MKKTGCSRPGPDTPRSLSLAVILNEVKNLVVVAAPPHGACGRGFAPVPNSVWGRGLFERSEFRSPNSRDRGKGTRRATPGRQWFWVLLPKQKDLAVRGRNPAFLPSPCGGRNLAFPPPRRAGTTPRENRFLKLPHPAHFHEVTFVVEQLRVGFADLVGKRDLGTEPVPWNPNP